MIERAISRNRATEQSAGVQYHSDKGLVMLLTLSVVVAAAGGILWMFKR
ncbi:MAG: hypothetical protein ACJ8AD_09815 [Gemmatimonadaceae bacterium]